MTEHTFTFSDGELDHLRLSVRSRRKQLTDALDALDALDAKLATRGSASVWQHVSSDGCSHTFRRGGETRTLDGFVTVQAAAEALDD